MGKILFWLGVFAAVFLALKAIAVIQRKGTLKDRPTNGEAEPLNQDKQNNQDQQDHQDQQDRLPSLIACAKCGLHLPRQEAIERRGQFFCTTEHAD
jgi:uncharacterized protein